MGMESCQAALSWHGSQCDAYLLQEVKLVPLWTRHLARRNDLIRWLCPLHLL